MFAVLKTLGLGRYTLIAAVVAAVFFKFEALDAERRVTELQTQNQVISDKSLVISAKSDDAGHKVQRDYAAKRVAGHGPVLMTQFFASL